MLIGITSNGTSHQSINGIVCEECASPEDLAVPNSWETESSKDYEDILQKYMKWTPEDFKRNEELFVKNFPRNAELALVSEEQDEPTPQQKIPE